jgi:hypothetical protein
MSDVQFVEVAACTQDPQSGETIPGVKASEANIWGVYLRRGTPDEHYAEWVADCVDQPTAEILAQALHQEHCLTNLIIRLVEPE